MFHHVWTVRVDEVRDVNGVTRDILDYEKAGSIDVYVGILNYIDYIQGSIYNPIPFFFYGIFLIGI